jgi:broad specificity phosphatase PhoE
MLILLRHGRSTWNAEHRFQGQSDPGLDVVGYHQAALAASRVADLLEGAPVSIWSSDLRRARATAEIVGVRVGAGVGLDPRLREVALGTWEGLTEEAAARRHPAEWRRWQAGVVSRRGGGEDPLSAAQRVARVIREATAAPGSTVLVGHGVSLRLGLERLRATGAMDWPGPAPHLGNGQLVAVAKHPAPTEFELAALRS